jgi:acyl-CoA hydrolase
MTSRAYLTFVAIDRGGQKQRVPPLLIESDEDRRRCEAAHARRAERLARRAQLPA